MTICFNKTNDIYYQLNNRYFVLIDDIWSKQAWNGIQCAFPNNNNASRVMTTTRIQDVAKSCSFPHGGYVYHMKHLGIDDSEKLFLKRIFDHEEDFTSYILKKCDGLPLAIVNIASMLATKPTTKQEWGRVRNSLCSSFKQDSELDVVKRILLLSYYDLPHYLKICLLDLSIFPEDFEICCDRLVQRWMAEGFIIGHQGQCMEDTGRSYISELINRNMIQLVDIDSISGKPVACRVHDIMLDLIISLSAKENFVTIMDDEKLTPPSNTIRRLSLQGKCERWKLLPGTNKLSHVRSLTVFSDVKKMPLLLDFQVLRVLDLQGCSYVEDGDIMDIGCLIHLRFLSLRKCSRISEIPGQIGKLQHLQTLDLTFTGIKRLPGTIARLRQLVRLLIPQGVQLTVGIGNMESLEELYWFDVKMISPEVVLELGNMTKLKDVSINWEFNDATRDEESYQDYLMSSLCKLGEHDLRHLEIFMYNGSGSADFLVDSWCPPPRHLQTFKMNSGIATFLSRLPRWISSLSELTCLDIPIKQVGRGDLKVLGDLPSLLHLGLHLRESPQETLVIGPRGFQSLKCFFVGTWGRDGLSLMFEKGAMSKLEKLYCASMARDTYVVGYEFGIRQLTSLKHLHVSINCRGARAWEVEAAEHAIRNAAALLPNHPIPEIFRSFQKEMVHNEGLTREGRWW